MSDLAIQVSGTKRLLTKGKYCDKNIVVTAKGDNHYDTFWDVYQNNGGDYEKAFANSCWADEIYNPKQSIVCTASGEFAYQNNTKITDTKVPIEVRGCSANYMFSGCTNLKTIPLIRFVDNTGNATFAVGCVELENITFEGSIKFGIGFANSSKLTDASVQSILDHLADLTGQTTQKLTFHATVGGKLTDAQKAAITAKNWTLVY